MSPTNVMRRRRSQRGSGEEGSADDDAEERLEAELDPVERSEGSLERDRQARGQDEVKAIEDIRESPQGEPESFGPKMLQPLFGSEQVKRMEELHEGAPLLQSTRVSPPGKPEPGWDGGAAMMAETRESMALMMVSKGAGKGAMYPGRCTGTPSHAVRPSPQILHGRLECNAYEITMESRDASVRTCNQESSRRKPTVEGSVDGGKEDQVLNTPR